jgi:hypothetical protein
MRAMALRPSNIDGTAAARNPCRYGVRRGGEWRVASRCVLNRTLSLDNIDIALNVKPPGRKRHATGRVRRGLEPMPVGVASR